MPLMGSRDEERFLRGIAADQEDEALRLVYSDWLEEQGDLRRAAWLRAEAAWFAAPRKRGRKKPGVRGIDPVWKAMAGRPPFGILRPGLAWRGGGKPPTSEQVAALEAHRGRALPPDYAAFLLLFNGGVPSLPTLTVWNVDDLGEDEDASDSGMFGCWEPELRLYALGQEDSLGKPAHWSSAADFCSSFRGVRKSDLAKLMLIGTLSYPGDPPWVNRVFLDPRSDAPAPYSQWTFSDDGRLVPDEPLVYDSFIDLISDLNPA
ncbi:MAG: TIGR02996 domain-containing protein [Gemmataceae bacterium]|nr:TIGR02996 domain-containing protein [Gemmataceae bacterium]